MVFCNLTAALDPSTNPCIRRQQATTPCDMTLEGMPMDAPSSQPPRYNQQRVADFFRVHVRLYGNDWRALGWQSRGTQVRRFAVLADIGPLAQTRVLDV